jgi:hypothetical protein
MAAEPFTNRPTTTVPASAEKDAVAAESSVAGIIDPMCWEFRLTADRRRILVLVNRTIDPEFV